LKNNKLQPTRAKNNAGKSEKWKHKPNNKNNSKLKEQCSKIRTILSAKRQTV